MPGVKPVSELVKTPVPLPSIVWLSVMVGLGDVLQHTPLAATDAPQSDITFPPLEAVEEPIMKGAVVMTTGISGAVVKITSLP